MASIKEQLRRHSVALISLAVALSSLAYNTWRNEQTEANRNVRVAGIELLLKLGELDQVVFFSHWEHDQLRGNPHTGWAYVLTVRDLGQLTNRPATESATALLDVWQANWEGLGEDDAAEKRISKVIDLTRSDILSVLAALD